MPAAAEDVGELWRDSIEPLVCVIPKTICVHGECRLRGFCAFAELIVYLGQITHPKVYINLITHPKVYINPKALCM